MLDVLGIHHHILQSKMKYRIIDRASFPRVRHVTKAPTINFSYSTGVIYLSAAACLLLKLEAGDIVELVKDDDTPGSLGIRKTENPCGFRLRKKHGGLCFSSASLVQQILFMYGKVRTCTVKLEQKPKDGIHWCIRESVERKNW